MMLDCLKNLEISGETHTDCFGFVALKASFDDEIYNLVQGGEVQPNFYISFVAS